MQENQKKTRRIVMNAVMIGVYIALTFLTISMGGLKITFEHFPVVLSAVVFGPVDAMLVGGIGELLNQLFTFGLTPTTALWILPIVFRGAALGLCARLLKKQMSASVICAKPVPVVFLIICVISGIFSSCLNTVAFYVDSKMFGYYSYALVFGAFLTRILLSAITSVIIVIGTKAVLYALNKEHLI